MKTTVVDWAATKKDGAILYVRFQKKDGESVGYHRTTLEEGADMDELMQRVNADLSRLGFPPVSDAEIAQLKAL